VKLLRVCTVGGAVVFTLDWLLLSRAHAGYNTTRETISALAAHDARGWQAMALGQLAFAVAVLALAVLCVRSLGARGWAPAVLLAISAFGTVQLTVFRTICTASDSAWCTPLPRSAYPHQQWAHGVGAGIAFVSLHLACLACAWAAWRVDGLRDVSVAGLVSLAVALPNLLWFVTSPTSPWHGFAEKLFLTALAAFVAYAGLRLSSAPQPTVRRAGPDPQLTSP
jgi:hypothetical protein